MSCWPFLKHFPFVSNHHKILFGSRPELGVLSHGLTLATGAIPFTINHATYCLCCLKTKQNHKKETKLSEHLKTSLHILFDAWCKQNMVTELGDRYRIRRQNMLTWNRWKTPKCDNRNQLTNEHKIEQSSAFRFLSASASYFKERYNFTVLNNLFNYVEMSL